jgi:hypothetical protein
MGKELASDASTDMAAEAVRERLDADRRCPTCGVKLSQYNPGPNCWQHTIGWPWRGPSAKPRF